ncbi:hypothetical protein FHG87_003618 [Trinorchestia longiramus]|nr:hypothetical protein FHG87_003618 [Trinorchestia longiramus]
MNWSPLVPTGPHWSPLVPTGPHWSPLVPTGPHWSPLVPTGPHRRAGWRPVYWAATRTRRCLPLLAVPVVRLYFHSLDAFGNPRGSVWGGGSVFGGTAGGQFCPPSSDMPAPLHPYPPQQGFYPPSLDVTPGPPATAGMTGSVGCRPAGSMGDGREVMNGTNPQQLHGEDYPASDYSGDHPLGGGNPCQQPPTCGGLPSSLGALPLQNPSDFILDYPSEFGGTAMPLDRLPSTVSGGSKLVCNLSTYPPPPVDYDSMGGPIVSAPMTPFSSHGVLDHQHFGSSVSSFHKPSKNFSLDFGFLDGYGNTTARPAEDVGNSRSDDCKRTGQTTEVLASSGIDAQMRACESGQTADQKNTNSPGHGFFRADISIPQKAASDCISTTPPLNACPEGDKTIPRCLDPAKANYTVTAACASWGENNTGEFASQTLMRRAPVDAVLSSSASCSSGGGETGAQQRGLPPICVPPQPCFGATNTVSTEAGGGDGGGSSSSRTAVRSVSGECSGEQGTSQKHNTRLDDECGSVVETSTATTVAVSSVSAAAVTSVTAAVSSVSAAAVTSVTAAVSSVSAAAVTSTTAAASSVSAAAVTSVTAAVSSVSAEAVTSVTAAVSSVSAAAVTSVTAAASSVSAAAVTSVTAAVSSVSAAAVTSVTAAVSSVSSAAVSSVTANAVQTNPKDGCTEFVDQSFCETVSA